jgi:translation initiation factor 2 beta subunit (eIF-2beta)/eIF-5
MIFFSGHGYHDGNETILELSHGNDVPESIFRGRAKKTLVVLDCCRKIIKESLLESFAINVEKSAGLMLNRALCRKYYEEYILSIDNTYTTCYSCAENHTSDDIASKGGLYTYNLLETAKAKEQQNDINLSSQFRVYSIRRIHNETTSVVKRLSHNEQIPDMRTQRYETDFPFAIQA